MADTNKIEFGLKNIYIAPLTATIGTDGSTTYSYAKPVALVGAKSMSMSPEGEQSTIYADDGPWYTTNVNNGYSGDIGFVHFNDTIRQTIYKNVKTADGLLVERSDVEPIEAALLFECMGDKNRVRHVMYNVKFGNPSVDYATKEDGIEPTEVTIPYTATPIRLTTGETVTKSKCVESDAAYADFFAAVKLPALTTGD